MNNVKVIKKFLYIILILLSLLSCSGNDTVKRSPQFGKIDLSDYNWEEVVQLDGDWAFQWNALTTDISHTDKYIKVPSHWGQLDLPDIGYATYALDITGLPINEALALSIKDISNAYRIYIIENSDPKKDSPPRELIEVGKVARNEGAYIPHLMPSLSSFETHTGSIRLIIQVSNFTVDKGGIWSSVRIGKFQKSFLLELFVRASQFLLIGILLYIVVQNLFYYIQRPVEKSSLYFALFSSLLIIREISSGRLAWIFHGVSDPSRLFFEIWARIDISLVYFMPGVFMLFLVSIFPQDAHKKLLKFTTPFTFITGIITLSLPLLDFLFFLIYFEIFIIIVALYSVYVYIQATRVKRPGALAGLIGIIIFVISIINDILNAQEILQTGYYLGFGFLVFIFAQTLLISMKYDAALTSFELINKSLNRFVPQKMLEFLGKNSILEVGLGDAKEHKMTVFFSDIRSFTTLSETMTPDETFKFLNSYLSRISPAIRSHGGYIDKYLGDGILALFPGEPLDGILASLDILDALHIYNYHRSKTGYLPIEIGIGMHVGTLVLGTIGEDERIDGTVVADAVNLSSRLEELTKEYFAEIIISEEILTEVHKEKKIGYRYLGEIKVRGRKKPEKIYQVMRRDDPRMEYKENFEEAVKKKISGDLEGAHEIFDRLFRDYPKDLTLKSLKTEQYLTP